MKLLIVCQAIDETHPILGFFTRWVAELAKHFEHIEVITLQRGNASLPKNVTVHSLGKESGGGTRALYTFRFLKLLCTLHRRYDTVFVHMNPEYIALAGWNFWLGKKVALWYNHEVGSVALKLSHGLADSIFHTSPFAYTARYDQAIQMPAGIDTDIFKLQSVEKMPQSIYFQGRLAPAKRVHVLLEAFEKLYREGHVKLLTLVGPEDAPYIALLKKQYEDLIATGAIVFKGPVPNAETPKLFASHTVSVNLTAAGNFDKTVLESLATGTPCIVSSEAFRGVVPDTHILKAPTTELLYEKLKEAQQTSEVPVLRGHSLQELGTRLAYFMRTKTQRKPLLNRVLWAALFAVQLLVPRKPRVTVLMYHSVGYDGGFFTVTPEVLEKHLRYVKRNADSGTLEQVLGFLQGKKLSRDLVVFTSDDGYQDFADHALPLFAQHGVPITLYTLAGNPTKEAMGSTLPLIDPLKMHALTPAHVESHGMSHRKLTKLSHAECEKELSDSKQILGAEHFAYPKGSYNREVAKAIEAAGYKSAVTAVARGVMLSDSTFAIPRVQIDATTSMTEFRAKLTPAADWYYYLWGLTRI